MRSKTADLTFENSTHADDLAWAERCDHWLNTPTERRRPGRAPRHINKPLVLTGHGMRLSDATSCGAKAQVEPAESRTRAQGTG
jgi:hypothetical protein